MRFVAFLFLTFTLSACNKADKVKVNNDDDYGEYEIAVPEQNGRKPAVHVVEISQMKFIPEVLKVSKGDTVVWINKDMVAHDVTELNSNLWSSSKMAAGASWKIALQNSQVYYCSLHVVMKGKIVVDNKDIAMNDSAITMCGSDVK
jgi:plastocyanin